jgi:hypothetical protein
MITQKTNHLFFIIDASSSMEKLKAQVVAVMDGQVGTLAQQSSPEMHDQETRITIYTFSDRISHGEVAKCLIWDKDVLRVPSVKGLYVPYGWTALCDAMIAVLAEARQIPIAHGDHSFLIILLSDGKENKSLAISLRELPRVIRELPQNWTVAAFAPGVIEKLALENLGFPPGNVQVWNPDEDNAVQEVGETISAVTDSYMAARSEGMQGTRNLFSMAAPKVRDLIAGIPPLTPGSYYWLEVSADDFPQGVEIAQFITHCQGTYTPGKVLYQMMKRERIQEYKKVAVKADDDVYISPELRIRLGLPTHSEARISPGAFAGYSVYVESRSFNRKLMGGTRVLVLR